MSRHKWIYDVNKKITKNIGEIFKYADANLRTEKVFENIKRITELVREGLK